jgi:hypothetical protein
MARNDDQGKSPGLDDANEHAGALDWRDYRKKKMSRIGGDGMALQQSGMIIGGMIMHTDSFILLIMPSTSKIFANGTLILLIF